MKQVWQLIDKKWIPNEQETQEVYLSDGLVYCVTLFQDDSSMCFLLSLTSSPFQAQPILLLPFSSSNGILSICLLSQATKKKRSSITSSRENPP